MHICWLCMTACRLSGRMLAWLKCLQNKPGPLMCADSCMMDGPPAHALQAVSDAFSSIRVVQAYNLQPHVSSGSMLDACLPAAPVCIPQARVLALAVLWYGWLGSHHCMWLASSSDMPCSSSPAQMVALYGKLLAAADKGMQVASHTTGKCPAPAGFCCLPHDQHCLASMHIARHHAP